MERPTIKSNYTKDDLVKYAAYRKEGAMKDIEQAAIPNVLSEPLAITKFDRYSVQLSWGGDGDGFKIDKMDGEVYGGVYYWEDWGVYEEVELTQEEAEQVAETYLIE